MEHSEVVRPNDSREDEDERPRRYQQMTVPVFRRNGGMLPRGIAGISSMYLLAGAYAVETSRTTCQWVRAEGRCCDLLEGGLRLVSLEGFDGDGARNACH